MIAEIAINLLFTETPGVIRAWLKKVLIAAS